MFNLKLRYATIFTNCSRREAATIYLNTNAFESIKLKGSLPGAPKSSECRTGSERSITIRCLYKGAFNTKDSSSPPCVSVLNNFYFLTKNLVGKQGP